MLCFCMALFAKAPIVATYTKQSYMVPMRDGTKLYTVIFTPNGNKEASPFLIERTPYGVQYRMEGGKTIASDKMGKLSDMAKEGYIFVFQDLRGKFKSEGNFEMNRPLYHVYDKSKTDESTDAYDLVDWLLKNIPNNNGRAGIHGISYPGYLALDAAVDPHPALKASSPQASPTDMFLGDDFHHNGAFRLSYGFEYSYLVENDKGSNSSFPFGQYDVYDWYMKLGPLKNVNEKYFKNRLPSWNDFEKHPNYDEFWKRQSMLSTVLQAQIPILHVGGYYDQEDLNGPQIMYAQLEKKDNQNLNYLLLGPWNHGGWAREKAENLGNISFGSNTAAWFQALEKKWFDHWLKGEGKEKFAEANCFQTGSNIWKSYDSWPPAGSAPKKLFMHADGSCSFEQPAPQDSSITYTSDPATPVPYRTLPIEATYGEGSRWNSWQVEDQRFVSTRPDVIVFKGNVLKDAITITGNVSAHLLVSTTGSDADFIVKLIDVYPDIDKERLSMSGYQFPVAMEVFRGRFRKGFDKPTPFEPGKPEEIIIDLHQINHQFKQGHRLMVQVQSSWFPVIDRNPQKFVPSIFQATAADYIKADHTIYLNAAQASYIQLSVIADK